MVVDLQLPMQSVPITTIVVHSWRGILDTTLCDKVCQLIATVQWFSLGTLVSSSNKTDCHNINEILLKVALNTPSPPPPPPPSIKSEVLIL